MCKRDCIFDHLIKENQSVYLRTREIPYSGATKQILKQIIRVYVKGDFTVHVILMDMEFEKVTDELGHVTVNISAVREYLAEIERGIRWVKERSCAMVANIPFKFLHKQVVIYLV